MDAKNFEGALMIGGGEKREEVGGLGSGRREKDGVCWLGG
jgi:hypothetical protein